ncbi:MAG TPA: peptide ABC transporter substrate-binding protein [Actinomycetota bacterium]|nr:peptide ABC transporter substrate-binding protein [Actinomycetota bacterium]
MQVRVALRTLALGAVVGIVAAACRGAPTPTPGQTPTASPTETIPQGGEIVVAAEQWPECINPIVGTCTGLTWTWWSVLQQVMPGAMELDVNGNFIASPLIEEAPTLENGGLTQNPFTVRYKIRDEAVWEDGTPITWEDFDFTWRAILNTRGTYTTAGYEQIEKIEPGDTPKDVIITFKEVYVDWMDLFGGVYQGLLKKAAFTDVPGFPDKPNLAKVMQDNIPFSGRHWILESWSKDQAVFVRNENYWGPKAILDKVTFVPRTDQATEIQSLLSGEVAVIFPQPSDVSLIDQVAVNPNVKAVGANGAYYDGLWFNLDKPPLNDRTVREALMYAIDRQAVIDNIIKLNNPTAEVLNCGAISFPHIGPWCKEKVFEPFHYDPQRSIQLLESAGYDCSQVPDKPCTKDGQPLTILYSVNAGNSRRETTQQLLIEKLRAAGFGVRIKNVEAGIYFGEFIPKAQHGIVDYAQGGSVDPGITGTFSCQAIPTEENEWSGGNLARWCNPRADELMRASDRALDPAERLDLLTQVYRLQAEDRAFLPLYVLPNVVAWRTDKVAGPVDKYVASNYGVFWNMWEWHLPAS